MDGETALATIDTTDVSTGAEETSTALTTTNDTSLATTDDSGAEETGGELATTGDSQVYEGGKLSTTTRTAIDGLRKSNPRLAHAIPRALAIEQRLRAEFPGVNAFDAIKSMRKEFKALGGEEGIAQIRSSLAEMEEMDLLYAAGDPRMLSKMTDTPEGKSAFQKLAPHAFALYEKLAPKAFSKYLASTFIGDLVGNRVDMTIQRLAELIPAENTLAVAEVAKLDTYLKRLAKLEQQEPEAVATAAADPGREQLEKDRQALQIEKRQIALQGWRSAADSEKSRIFDQAWATETKGRKVSEIDKEDIQARFWTRLPIALKQVTGFNDSLKEFFESDDKAGYLRYLQSLHAEKIPAILRAEINRRLGAPAAKPGAAAAATTATTTATTKTQVDSGFKRVATRPELANINMVATRPIFHKKQAILKDGSRVQWS